MPGRRRPGKNTPEGRLLGGDDRVLAEVAPQNLGNASILERFNDLEQSSRRIDCEHRLELLIQGTVHKRLRAGLIVCGIRNEPRCRLLVRYPREARLASVESSVDDLDELAGTARIDEPPDQQAPVMKDRPTKAFGGEVVGVDFRGFTLDEGKRICERWWPLLDRRFAAVARRGEMAQPDQPLFDFRIGFLSIQGGPGDDRVPELALVLERECLRPNLRTIR